MQEGPQAPSQGKYAPAADYSPEQYDSALVHLTRAQALEAITMASSTNQGELLAWESVVSFAETLMPMAGTAFLRYYTELRQQARKSENYPNRALWRICSLEAKRQHRLGKEATPIDIDRFGVEPQ